MKTTKRSPARKTTKAAPKKATVTKDRAAKDVLSTAAPTAPRAAKPPRERDARLPAVGATISKEWRGKTLQVKCLTDGFAFDGATHRTLSAAARAASGFPSVNGFLFFGLTPSAEQPKDSAAPPATKASSPKAKSNKGRTTAKRGPATNETGPTTTSKSTTQERK